MRLINTVSACMYKCTLRHSSVCWARATAQPDNSFFHCYCWLRYAPPPPFLWSAQKNGFLGSMICTKVFEKLLENSDMNLMDNPSYINTQAINLFQTFWVNNCPKNDISTLLPHCKQGQEAALVQRSEREWKWYSTIRLWCGRTSKSKHKAEIFYQDCEQKRCIPFSTLLHDTLIFV